jgi:hypothetical protein
MADPGELNGLGVRMEDFIEVRGLKLGPVRRDPGRGHGWGLFRPQAQLPGQKPPEMAPRCRWQVRIDEAPEAVVGRRGAHFRIAPSRPGYLVL